MTEKIDAARTMRIGAETLRKIATRETDPGLVSELLRFAQEMDEHAEIERSIANEPLNAHVA